MSELDDFLANNNGGGGFQQLSPIGELRIPDNARDGIAGLVINAQVPTILANFYAPDVITYLRIEYSNSVGMYRYEAYMSDVGETLAVGWVFDGTTVIELYRLERQLTFGYIRFNSLGQENHISFGDSGGTGLTHVSFETDCAITIQGNAAIYAQSSYIPLLWYWPTAVTPNVDQGCTFPNATQIPNMAWPGTTIPQDASVVEISIQLAMHQAVTDGTIGFAVLFIDGVEQAEQSPAFSQGTAGIRDGIAKTWEIRGLDSTVTHDFSIRAKRTAVGTDASVLVKGTHSSAQFKVWR